MARSRNQKRNNHVLAALAIVVAILTLPFIVGAALDKTNLFSKAQTDSSFSFAVAGDFGKNTNATAVFNAIKNSNTDFAVGVGDYAYGSSTPSQWATYLRSIIGDSYPFEIISGNHDDDMIDQYVAALPDKIGNSVGDYGKEYYFDYPVASPIARFILLSPDLLYGYPYAVGDAHYAWVSDVIDSARSSGIPWVFVGMHRDCLNMGSKSCEIKADLMNLLINKKVDVVLQGHDHNYQRTKQLQCATVNSFNSSCVADASNALTKGAGTVFVIVGTGGRNMDPTNTADSESGYFANWMGSNTNQTWGLAKFTVNQERVDMEFVRALGGTFTDSFSIISPNVTSGPTQLPSPTDVVLVTPTPTLTQLPTPTPTGAASKTTISKKIITGRDDVEQDEASGTMIMGNSSLDMVMNGTVKQTVGFRFTGIFIPKGAVIQNAYIEFTARRTSSEATSLTIYGHATDNSPAFTTSVNNVSNRSKTASSVLWSTIPAWSAGSLYRTPDLSSVIQEIVNRAGWNSGNAMAFIVTGTGRRVAESYNSSSAKAAKLVITYQ